MKGELTSLQRKLYLVHCLTFCFLLFLNSKSFSQGEANVWIGPTRVGLDFNSGSPTAFLTGTARGVINAGGYEGEGCSSIADADGNLLFYTEGVNVYNRNHVIMSNGSGLLGNLSSTQSAVIVPCPANPTRFYYIFCAPPEEASASPGGSQTSSDGITYSIVDMNGDGGLGQVTTKNVRITPIGENATEGLTAVPNFSGDGFWIIGHQAGEKTSSTPAYNKFYIYGVTEADINPSTGVINSWNNQSANAGTGIGGVPGSTSGNGQVIIKSNNCFNKLAMSFFAKNQLIEIYNFNNSTGAISLANSITNLINNQVYGIEFSPNGTYLYATILETNHRLYQFDISSGVDATINASRHEWTPTGTASLRWGQLQLGPDGKIYMAHHVNWAEIGAGSPHASIGVINNPNLAGAAANFVEQQITSTTLTGTGTKHGLPQIYKGFIAGVASVDPGDGLTSLDSVCVGEPAEFLANYTQTGTNWRWNIDANIGPNTTNEYFTQNIVHTYSSAGTYQVILTLDDATCGYEVSDTTLITVNPVYTAAGTVTCNTPKGNVTSPDGSVTYVWYADAAFKKPIATGTTNVDLPIGGTGNVYLRAESSVSSSNVNAVLRNSGTPNGWDTPGTSSTVFTVNHPITLNSFQWAPGTAITGWPCPDNKSMTVSVENNAGTVTLYTATRNYNACDPVTLFTEYPGILLPIGTYRIVFSEVGRLWNSSTPTSAADNSVTITSGANNIGFFNYSATTYTVTGLPCSKPATIPFDCPLPVTWLNFTVQPTSAGNLLNWSTAKEVNSKSFEIEKSYNGINFETIGQMAGAGNSNSIQNYTFVDRDESPVVYYRIKQIDFDGNYSYSVIRSVLKNQGYEISILPNPNNGIFSIQISGLKEDSELFIVNSLGQIVWNKTISPNDESRALTLNLAHLPKGVYHVKMGGKVQKIVIE